MRATSIAAVEVTVDGSAVPGELAARVISARVATRLGLPAQCELAYATQRDASADLPVFPLGGALTVRVAGNADELFAGEVTCRSFDYTPDGGTVVRVRAYDRLHRLRKSQQLRVFTDVTAVELAARLAGEPAGSDDDGPTFARIVQHGQTDLELLRQVAARAGLYPVVADGDLRLVTLAGQGSPTELDLGVTLLEASVQANLDRAAAELTALGWDTRSADRLAEGAKVPRIGHAGGPGPGDLGLDGAAALVDQAGGSADELAALAQAELDRRAAATVTLRGVAAGAAGLRAGGKITVRGVADEFAGDYVLTEAVHTVDATGYLTTLSTEPPEPPSRPPVQPAMTLGTVTDVDDPDNLGRVQVTLPAHGDADVGWLGVVCPGAGRKRGIVALPDVGDTVLVALPHGPVGAIVLGGLFGSNTPPDAGVQGGRVERWSLRTDDGQRVIVDDAKHSVTVANRGGSMLRLAPGKVTLRAATDLDIAAPGKTITVTANAVEFVQEA